MATRNRILFLLTGLLGIVVLFCIVLYFSVPKLVNSEVLKKKANAFFQEKTGGRMAFKNSDIHLFPIPHIDFQQLSISVPGKVDGHIQTLDIYPDVWALIRGEVRFSTVRIESPRFTVALSEDVEKPSLEQIEKNIRSFVHDLTSISHDLSMTIQKGELDLTKGGRVAFSFDAIQSRLAVSGKSLKLSLTSTSNLWDDISFNTSLHAEDLKSKGTVQITNFKPHNLLTQLVPKMAWHIRDAETNLFVQFQALGLRQISGEVKSSVPSLFMIRGDHRAMIKDLSLKGAIEIEPKSVSVLLNELSSAHPGLKLSGKYILDRTSGIMDLGLEGDSIDVQSTRDAALSIGSDIPVIRNVFDIVRGGKIPSLHFSTRGRTAGDLGKLNNMRITGKMKGGEIYIKAKDLSFHNVTGDVVIVRGILEGKNISASIEQNQGSNGTIRVGLKGKDAPFNLDMWVKADAGQLPSFLRQKHLIKNEAVLWEMARLSDIRGSVEGKLLLGDRLDSIHVVTDISKIDLFARYEPLPFPLTITGGQVFFDEKMLSTDNLNGSLGNSLFSNLTAKINLDDKADLEVTSIQATISADEIYPWVTSFEKIKPVLKEIPSMKGKIMVSSAKLQGQLYQPKDWKYLFNGELTNFAFNYTFFPGKAEETSGTFNIVPGELLLKDVRTKMIDSSFSVSGSIREFPAGIRNLDLIVQGETGPKVATWISSLIKLPMDMALRAPFSVSASHLKWDKDISTSFEGSLGFGKGTQVSLKMTKTPDELSVNEISVKDSNSDAKAGIRLKKKTADIIFKGVLTSDTLKAMFEKNQFSGSSIKGDIKSHILFKDPKQSMVEGFVESKNIPIPWGLDIPLVIQDIALNARGKNILLNPVQLAIGKEQFTGKGTIDTSGSAYSVDMDIASDGLEWENIEKILGGNKRTENSKNAGLFEDFPLKGTLRIQSDFFKYRQFMWEPLHADVSFDGKTLHIISKKASLCGISTTGNIEITDQGIDIDVALSAKNLELQPTILCISDKKADITGRFEMKAELKAKGKLDTIAKSMNGSFSISAKKGKIFKSKSLDKTLDLVNETENVKGKLPDLDKTVISYHTLTARGTMRENVVDLEEGMLDASNFGILAQGRFDIHTQTLDLNALVAPVNFAQRIVGKVPVLGSVLGGNIISIPVKIKGKMYDPQVNFLSPSAIGSAFFGIIKRTIKLPITIIEPILPGKKQE